MTRDEKLRIARQLERMRVNVIEAGFAAASNGDFEAVKAVAEAIKDSTVCSLAGPTRPTSAAPARRSARRPPAASTPSSPPARSTWRRSCA